MKPLKTIKKWSVANRLSLVGLVVTCIGIAIPLFLPKGENGSNFEINDSPKSGNVNVSGSPGAVVLNNSPGATQVVKMEERTLYRAASAEIEKGLNEALNSFKTRHSTNKPFIRIDVEAGTSSRTKVAEYLGGFLQKLEIGRFDRTSTSIGVAPDSPITLFFAPKSEAMASDFLESVGVFISGKTVLKPDSRLSANQLRFYLNGTPLFTSAGKVEID